MSDINVPSGGLFHPLTGPRPEESSSGDTRVFVVPGSMNGQPLTELPIPGCIKVKSVRIGNTFIPEFIEYDAPDSVRFDKKLHVRLPAYAVDRNYLGEAVLRRNPVSNDGVWQAGESVYIVGDWEEDKSQPPAGGKKAAA